MRTNALPETNIPANAADTLAHAARTYNALGYSTLFVTADKKPASLRWKQAQAQAPSLAAIDKAARTKRAAGVAIVCGRVSRLLVLDIDNKKAAASDRYHLLPARLRNTATVRTPSGGYHLYYRLPAELLSTPTARGYYGDLQANGAYVVAPPSNGYTIARYGDPLEISAADLPKLRACIGVEKRPPGQGRLAGFHVEAPASAEGLLQEFEQAAARMGRNDALYRVALSARYGGLSHAQASAALLDPFTHAPAPARHARQAEQSRRAEGVRTIASAYSDRIATQQEGAPRRVGLSTAARETLLQQGMTSAARLLDAAYSAGQAGRTIPLQEAAKLAGIGKNAAAQASTALQGLTPCTVRRKNEGKNTRGRPQRYITIPTPRYIHAQLCSKQPFVQAEIADHRRASEYRRATHASLVARLRGPVTRAWQAAKLGVTARTIRTYDKLLSLKTRIFWRETPLSAEQEGQARALLAASKRYAVRAWKWVTRQPALVAQAMARGYPCALLECKGVTYA